MKLLVQDFLETQTFTDLFEKHGVNARISARDPSVFSLNYDQLAVRDSDPLSQDCRGLVLRSVNGPVDKERIIGPTEIIALPFKRFFNYGTESAAPIVFEDKDTRFFEKLDGTCCILYHDPKTQDWHIATRSVPDADVKDAFGKTFRQAFEQALLECTGNTFAKFTAGLQPELTYVFELTAPDNQIVVFYEKREVTLLAVRNKVTGEEIEPEPLYGVNVCPSYRINNVVDMLKFVTEAEPSKHEGLVVRDSKFRRVKVKSPGYLALSKVRDSVAKSPRAMISLILLGKEDDARAFLPAHIIERMDKCKEAIRRLCERTDAAYHRLHSEDRKTFALAIQAEQAWMSCHMTRFSKKCENTWDYIQKSQKNGEWPAAFLDTIMDMSGYRPGTDTYDE